MEEAEKKMDDIASKTEKCFKTVLPELGKIAMKMFDENFDLAGFRNNGAVSAWERRKYRANDDGHPLLQDTLALRTSISVLSTDEKSITVGYPIIYADPMNKTRQFLGISTELEDELMKKVEEELKKIFK